MGLFNALVSVAVQTVILPIEIAKDAATLGGSITDQHVPYTVQRLQSIDRRIQRAVDEIDL